MKKLQTALFIAYFSLMMIVLGGTIFSVVVEYPNWFADVPTSLESTRNFYRVLHPGHFFQTFAPLLVVTGIGFVIAGWRTVPVRNLVLITVVIMIAIELLTFFYIYPRLWIMFGPDAASQTVDAMRNAACDFTAADRVRTFMDLVASALSIAALLKFFDARREV